MPEYPGYGDIQQARRSGDVTSRLFLEVGNYLDRSISQTLQKHYNLGVPLSSLLKSRSTLMKKLAASLLLAVGIAAVGVAGPAAAAPLNIDSGSKVVSPYSYWPNPR